MRFGAIPLSRVWNDPAPGTASEEDIIRIHDPQNRLCELVDGTLIEKSTGTYESYLAMMFGRLLSNHAAEHDLGIVLGADGMVRLAPGLVRIPDVAFISWGRLPDRQIPDQAIAELAPDLAVEVISAGNTIEEMERKLREYFHAGVRLVWYVYPKTCEIHVFSVDSRVTLTADHRLDGADVIPGFELKLIELFQRPRSKPV